MKRFLLVLVLFLLVFFISPKAVLADCQIATWDPNTRTLMACVGGFATKDQLRATTATVECTNNSNAMVLGIQGLCRDQGFDLSKSISISLSSTLDSNIEQDSNGYFTCIGGSGLNRGIGEARVSFSGGTTCTTEKINTLPNNWNLLSAEAINIFGDPGNDPKGASSPTCISGGKTGINTAIGCIPVEDPNAFLGFILKWAIGVGGGIAFLLVVYSSFMIMSSSGNPERLKAGQELLTSAIMGVILLIFSVFILKIIGVDILKIPGFSTGQPAGLQPGIRH